MDINKRISELKQEFKSNANLRYEWDTIRNSEAYRKISELVFLESAASLSKVGAAEHDIVAARRLFKHQSVQEVFQALNQVHIPDPEPVPIPPGWDQYGKELEE